MHRVRGLVQQLPSAAAPVMLHASDPDGELPRGKRGFRRQAVEAAAKHVPL